MTDAELERLLDLDRSSLPPDGGPDYNRLIFSRSPYLLQHAQNPTSWQQWGEEAFAEARRRNVPLFVSIGYATCHWCHVMAHECFADGEVAALLNEAFVPVKVDREERPDLDEFFMAAAMALNGSGGWPLNVFVDHRGRPFFACTYLPKESRPGMAGFTELLRAISRAWQQQPDAIARNTDALMEGMAPQPSADPVSGGDRHEAAAALQMLQRMYDPLHGGFGGAPKFPMAPALRFLLSLRGEDGTAALPMAIHTLKAMASGGIQDQLAGGFHRYAVDERWQVPHFEKMLYDQALLVLAYCDGFAASGEEWMLSVARSTAGFVLAELTDSEGGFCAALDADSAGEEGQYYLWTPAEMADILGAESSLWCLYWGIGQQEMVEGGSVLHGAVEPEPFARSQGMTLSELEQRRQLAADRLLERRSSRVRPLRDRKVLASWNGLMIGALARLADVSGEEQWLLPARRAVDQILSRMVTSRGRLLRSWLRGPSDIPAFLEDYACCGWGFTLLAEASGDAELARRGRWLGEEMLRLFCREDGTLTFCGTDGEPLPILLQGGQDGALPAAGGMAALFLARLAAGPEGELFAAACRRLLERQRGEMQRNPFGSVTAIMAMQELLR